MHDKQHWQASVHAVQALMDKLDRDLEYAISVECKTPLEDVADYEQVSSGFCRPMLASAKRWAGCLLHIHPGDSFWKPVGICLKHHHVRNVQDGNH